MKKIFLLSFFLIASVLTFSVNNDTANAATPVTEESSINLDSINEKTDELVAELNKKLESGNLDRFNPTTVEGVSEDGVHITVGVEPVRSFTSFSAVAAADSVIDYSAFVNYDSVGFDFSHRLYGTFKANAGKVSNVTAKVEQTGWAYNKTYSTNTNDIDASVKEVVSTGNFAAFYLGKQYVVYLDVKVFGSGNYTVTRAKIV